MKARFILMATLLFSSLSLYAGECGDSGHGSNYNAQNPLTECSGSSPVVPNASNCPEGSEVRTSGVKNSFHCDISHYNCKLTGNNGARLTTVVMPDSKYTGDADKQRVFTLEINGKYYGGWYHCGYPSAFLDKPVEDITGQEELTCSQCAELAEAGPLGDKESACRTKAQESGNCCGVIGGQYNGALQKTIIPRLCPENMGDLVNCEDCFKLLNGGGIQSTGVDPSYETQFRSHCTDKFSQAQSGDACCSSVTSQLQAATGEAQATLFSDSEIDAYFSSKNISADLKNVAQSCGYFQTNEPSCNDCAALLTTGSAPNFSGRSKASIGKYCMNHVMGGFSYQGDANAPESNCCSDIARQSGFNPQKQHNKTDYNNYISGLNQTISTASGDVLGGFQIEQYCPKTFGTDLDESIEDQDGEQRCNSCVSLYLSGGEANPAHQEWCDNFFLKSPENACCTQVKDHYDLAMDPNGQTFYSEGERHSFYMSNVPSVVRNKPELENRIQNFANYCQNDVAPVQKPTCQECGEWRDNNYGTDDEAVRSERELTCQGVYANPGNQGKPECSILGSDGDLCTKCFDHVLAGYNAASGKQAAQLKDMEIVNFDSFISMIKNSTLLENRADRTSALNQCKDEIMNKKGCCENLSTRLLNELGFDSVQVLEQELQSSPERRAQICENSSGYLMTLEEACPDNGGKNSDIRDVISTQCLNVCRVDSAETYTVGCCIGVYNAVEDGVQTYQPKVSSSTGKPLTDQEMQGAFGAAQQQCEVALRSGNISTPANDRVDFPCHFYSRWQMSKAIAHANNEYNPPQNHEEFSSQMSGIWGDGAKGQMHSNELLLEGGRLGDQFRKWYAENAVTNYGKCPEGSDDPNCISYTDRFCQYRFDTQIALRFCSEEDLEVVKELNEQYCSGKSLCEMCVTNVPDGQGPPANCLEDGEIRYDVQQNCCQLVEAKFTDYINDATGNGNTKIPHQQCVEIQNQVQRDYPLHWNGAQTITSEHRKRHPDQLTNGTCPLDDTCGGNAHEPLDPNAKGPCDKFGNFGKYFDLENSKYTNPFLKDEYNRVDLSEYAELISKKDAVPYKDIDYEVKSFFNKCQKQASTGWGDVVNSSGEEQDKRWTLSWAILAEKFFDDVAEGYLNCKAAEKEAKRQLVAETQNKNVSTVTEAEIANITAETAGFSAKFTKVIESNEYSEAKKALNPNADEYFEKIVQSFEEDMTEHIQHTRKCASLANMTHHTDYNDAEANLAKEKAASDGSITCTKASVLTQDWEGCNGLIGVYDAAIIAEQAMILAQQIDFKSKQSEWNLALQQDEDQIKAPIKLQIKTLEQQKKYMDQQAAAYTAKGVTLHGAVVAMPKMKDLIGNCEEKVEETTSDFDYKFLLGAIHGDESEKYKAVDADKSIAYGDSGNKDNYVKPTVCSHTIKKHGSNLQLILNDPARDQGNAHAIQAGIKAAELLATSHLIKKNIAKLYALLNGIDDFEPEDINYSIEDLIAQECEINPTSPACGNVDPSSVDVGFLSQSISVDGNSATSAGQYNLPDQDGSAFNTGTTDTGATGDKMSPIDFGKKGTGGLKASVGGANVKSNKAGWSGGGGGGGAGRMAAASGGSGRNTASGGKSRYQSKDYAYKGKSQSLGYSGGSGKSKKTSKGKSLFGKLFNKSAKKKEVLNFRDLASEGKIGKANGRNLFKMISDRYDKVENKKQLLEYEASKK